MTNEEEDESRTRWMDLNLYLGLPRSYRPRSLYLGSDLALSSTPLSSSFSDIERVERRDLAAVMSGAAEQPSDSHSPSHVEYIPNLPAVLPADRITTAEYAHELASPFVQDPEGADSPYSPYSVHPLPTDDEFDESSAQEFSSHVPYNPAPPVIANETLTYSSPYISEPSTMQDHGATASGFHQSVADRRGVLANSDGGSSSGPWSLESHLRWLMESNNRWPMRRFRSSLSRLDERFDFGSSSSPDPEQLVDELLRLWRPSECNGKDKLPAEDSIKDDSEGEKEGSSRNAGNFECNICLDMAAEPVVTSCGHLFCWPCLYQWLHVHSDHKECPVCKGEVTESNITPIYGRGSSQSVDGRASGLKVPPRPSGNRFESIRQQYRPVSRRLGEGIPSVRWFLDQQIRNGNQYEGRADTTIQEMLDGVQQRTLTGLRARLQREANPQGGMLTGELETQVNTMQNPVNNSANSILGGGIDFWHRFSLYGFGTERITSITADPGQMVGHFANNSNGHGVSTSSVNSPNPEPLMDESPEGVVLAADEASASSTMAVIQGEAAPDSIAEPNASGTLHSNRRRSQNSMSGSFDIDDGTLHGRKRRRLN